MCVYVYDVGSFDTNQKLSSAVNGIQILLDKIDPIPTSHSF